MDSVPALPTEHGRFQLVDAADFHMEGVAVIGSAFTDLATPEVARYIAELTEHTEPWDGGRSLFAVSGSRFNILHICTIRQSDDGMYDPHIMVEMGRKEGSVLKRVNPDGDDRSFAGALRLAKRLIDSFEDAHIRDIERVQNKLVSPFIEARDTGKPTSFPMEKDDELLWAALCSLADCTHLPWIPSVETEDPPMPADGEGACLSCRQPVPTAELIDGYCTWCNILDGAE